jgi:hypothetical protein
VNFRAADHFVAAPVPGPARPWKLRTLQKCGPADSEWRVSLGWLSPVTHCSTPPQPPAKLGVELISSR